MPRFRFSVLSVTWSKHGDRWMLSGYHDGLDLEAIIARAAKIDGLSGIELVNPQQINPDNHRRIAALVKDAGLEICSIANSISGRREYYHGALTSPDPRIRQQAIDTVKAGLDVAAELGVPRTNLWLGREGYNYPFQVDYAEGWDLLVAGLRECAAHQPGVQICIEYKLRDPKAHLYAATASRTLRLIDEVGAPNLGVLMDTGHTLYAYESMAETIVELHRAGKLFHFHLNDNYRLADDDMIVGSVHFFEFIEALYWLIRIGYDGWISFDPHPLGEDETRSVEEGVRFVRGVLALLDRVGHETIARLLKNRQATEVYRILQQDLFRG
jgi:sugar phosphate isomerase/epimerase